MEIVSALRATLADQVGSSRFDMWFGPATRLEFDGHCLTIGAPNQFFLEWIRTNFRRDIENACLENLGKRPELKFRIDQAEDSSNKRPHNLQQDSRQPSGERNVSRPERSVDEEPAADDSETPALAAIGSNRRRFARLETFVSGETNRLAFASAEMVVRRPGQMTPLMIHGPSGIGKTHLLEGIRTATRKTHRNLMTVYLSAEQFTTYFLEALRGSGLPSFRRKYRGVGLLMIDDLQFLAGKRATQIELLHTIDTLLREGRQLVFTADRPPEELAELGSELTTRLQSGMVCRIERPDYATRLGIVAGMAERFQMNLRPEVQQFVASRLTNHARELSGALCRLQATSEALGLPIDVPLAEEALAEMIRQGSRAVRLPDIEKAVCDVFGLDPATLQSGGRAKRVSHPRMLAMWLARKHTRAALSEIGHFFGRRSHSTVVSAQKRVDGWMEEGTSVVLAEGTWNADEVIRRVERQLQAG
ncbi:MAG TPA: chromosomal replication initiator protein DnaA [Thermoguttaceae bacterium]|nr:chromosomal replication initiator protein DnaA [Thermoguttaceae bacterium]